MPIQSQDIIVVGLFLLPLSSIQHFIWPLSWCLLADICNHTWIPECGRDDLIDELRIFIDECDMFEFNCDHETDYELVNYSECFGKILCPPPRKCPSRPPCPDHRFHRMGDKYVFVQPRRQGRRMLGSETTLPMRMMKGKRRYTPERAKRRKQRTRITTTARTRPKGYPTRHTWAGKKAYTSLTTTQRTTTTTTTTTFKMQTIILKRETIFRAGRRLVKIVKGIAEKPGKPMKLVENVVEKSDSDFLE